MAVYTVTISSAGSPDIVSLTDGSTYAVLEVSAGRGPKGDGFTGGSYNASTGVVTFTSNDGLGFSTGDIRPDLSEPGPIGDVTPNTGAFTTITVAGTVDGRDVAADGSKLDGIEAGADVTDTANVTAAGALLTQNNLSDVSDVVASRSNLGLGTADDVEFASVQLSGGTGDEGTLTWNDSDRTLDLDQGGVTLQLGQETHFMVRNQTGSTIGNGTFLGFSGVTAGSNRIMAAPFDPSTMDANLLIGFATEGISNGVNGLATTFGYVRELDTRGDTASNMAVGDETWAVGDMLYVHPTVAGKLTNVAPTSGIKAAVAAITNRHATQGEIFVRVTAFNENAYATAAQAGGSARHYTAVLNAPQAALSRFTLTTQGSGSGNVVQGFASDPYTNELYTLHVTGTPDTAVINKFEADGISTQTSYRWNSSPSSDIGHQELDISWDKSGNRWFWTAENEAVTNYARYIKRFQISDGSGTELTFSNVQQYQVWGTDVTGSGSATACCSLDGRYLITEYNNSTTARIRVFDLNALMDGGAGDYSSSYAYEWSLAIDYTEYPLQSIASDGAYVYIFFGNIATGNTLKAFVYTIAGTFVREIDDFTVGEAEAQGDGAGTAYEMEGAGWIWHGGQPMLAVSIASGNPGARTNRVWVLGGQVPVTSYGDGNRPAFISQGSNDFAVPDGQAMRLGHYSGATDTFTERAIINSSGKMGIGTTLPAYQLDVQDTGDTFIRVKANSSGAGNDDDATLILDAAETGEAVLKFCQDGVAKASIEWFEGGSPDLNIRTESGTNGVIDLQPNNNAGMRVSDGGVIVYDELDPRGGIKSHYDSGWTSVSNNNYYDFTHNLGLTGDQMLVMVFVRDASNRIFQVPSGFSNNTTFEVGPSIYHKSTNVVQIATGNDGIYAYDNTELSGSVTLLTSGEYRVKIMKWI